MAIQPNSLPYRNGGCERTVASELAGCGCRHHYHLVPPYAQGPVLQHGFSVLKALHYDERPLELYHPCSPFAHRGFLTCYSPCCPPRETSKPSRAIYAPSTCQMHWRRSRDSASRYGPFPPTDQPCC